MVAQPSSRPISVSIFERTIVSLPIILRGLQPSNSQGEFLAIEGWFWDSYWCLVRKTGVLTQVEQQLLRPKSREKNQIDAEHTRQLATALRKLDAFDFRIGVKYEDGTIMLGQPQLLRFISFLEASGGFTIGRGHQWFFGR